MGIKNDLLSISNSAIKSVNPATRVRCFLRRERENLLIDDFTWDLSAVERVFLIAVGKAAVPMAAAAAEILQSDLKAGIVITKYGHTVDRVLPAALRLIEAGHPVPDQAGFEGAQEVATLLSGLGERDLVLVLISGGASALLSLPTAPISLQDMQETTTLLLHAGVTINEFNAVRKHLSCIKGGQLARMAVPAAVVTLILSDVVGDPLDVIASGPTSPDPTTFEDAKAILLNNSLWDAVPATVRDVISAGMKGSLSETPKPDEALFKRTHNFIVGSNRAAALAAVKQASHLGYNALLLTTFMEGEASEIAKVAVALAKGVRQYGDPLVAPACIVWGGETTVTVRGTGKGGRNQELAVSAAVGLAGMPDVGLLALATDGTDGPTDAGGALVDGDTSAAARVLGLSLRAALRENNAYPLLQSLGALLETGPTGTNVNDLMILLVK